MKKLLILLLYAFIGWAVCGLIMGIGPTLLPMPRVLIFHLIVAPLAFGLLSWHYHRYYRFTDPLQTALIFTSFVMLVDFFLVALVILKNLDMFKSFIGTWIPFGLIFLSAWLTGLNTRKG